MSGNQANHEGGDTADSNQSLWQQYLDAMNKFQESQKAATYSSNPPPLAANNSVGPAATKVENTIDDSNTGVGLESGWPGDDEDKQSVLTTPAPNNAHDNAQDDGDLVINFDNNNEVIFTSGQEETVSSKNGKTSFYVIIAKYKVANEVIVNRNYSLSEQQHSLCELLSQSRSYFRRWF